MMNIKGYSFGEVMSLLYDATTARGMGVLHEVPFVSPEMAEKDFSGTDLSRGADIDWYRGKPFKFKVTANDGVVTIDRTDLFNRDSNFDIEELFPEI
jgi:hypothetical protein